MLKVGTVFSGIGSFEQALKKMNIDHKIIFASDNGEREIDVDNDFLKSLNNQEQIEYIEKLYRTHKKTNYVQKIYELNNGKSADFYQDVRFINNEKYTNQVDLLVGGSPCQSFSVIGKQGGLDDARGTLFFDYAKLISSIKPRVFIFENVPGLLSHDKGNTWEIISKTFEELGYSWKKKVLNSLDFGVPQNRRRLFVLGFKNPKDFDSFEFPNPKPLNKTVENFLLEKSKIKNKYYLGKKGFEFVTNPKYKNRAKVNSKISMTQKANQQFNWNGDFRFEEVDSSKYSAGDFIDKAYVNYFNDKLGVIRKLTPRECFSLMGFPNSFYIPNDIPDVQLYRQSGNSIVVNVFEALLSNLDLT